MSELGLRFRGFQALLGKEVRRFSHVVAHSIGQPVVTTTLYFVVFGLGLGGRLRDVDGVPYVEFIVPGLVALAMVQAAFVSTSNCIFLMKTQGTFVDVLVAPLGWIEPLAAFTLASILRALLVGALTWVVATAFTGFGLAHPLWTVLFAVLVGATFGLVGLAAAIASDRFEQLSIVPTFFITPLTFLGGVFYSVSALPEPWGAISRANPITHMVEGLRYGMLGLDGGRVWMALAVTGGTLAASFAAATWMLATGYKLRS